MLFVVRFRVFLYIVLPTGLILQAAMLTQFESIYSETVQCSAILENFEYKNALGRDYTVFLYIAIGIYSQNYTLVSRFLNSEKAQLQQRQLTQVFTEQPDGLIVLKEVELEVDSESTDKLDKSSKDMTTVQQIEESFRSLTTDNNKVIRYEVKFQNKAVESIFGSTDIEKHLHTPMMVLDDKIKSLHEVMKPQNIQQNIRVLQREDHLHLQSDDEVPRPHPNTDNLLESRRKKEDSKHEVWISIRKQDIIFDNEKCSLLSLHNHSARHRL